MAENASDDKQPCGERELVQDGSYDEGKDEGPCADAGVGDGLGQGEMTSEILAQQHKRRSVDHGHGVTCRVARKTGLI